jgi:hypothetical protein
MPYEPGSPECRVLIDCKTQIESMLLALGRIESSEPIREQLRAVHHQLSIEKPLTRATNQPHVLG